ncbi:hypothetical protein [Streptomyces sulfonofaciens]|nr:hypothetical protein [Streptomyces sulfonofaciens]
MAAWLERVVGRARAAALAARPAPVVHPLDTPAVDTVLVVRPDTVPC